jgi:DNA-binding response OmpR family regulator
MSKRTVIIVDDEVDCASMLQLALEVALETSPGISVLRVSSAEAALEAMRHVNLAALVSDVHLPGKTGLELIANAGAAPVVIVSASTDAGVKEEAMRMGAVAFFSKPFSPAEVCRTVRALLDGN